MGLVAAAILVERALPSGERLTRLFGLVLVALGVWVASSAATVPALTQPDGGGTEMEMKR
jgi:hypothetical protein